MSTVPAAWMPSARMVRVHFHWTAGAWKATDFDRAHYHVLIEDDGKPIRGIPTIDANADGSKKRPRASHTLNANTGAIGVAVCAMGDKVDPSRVKERPFFAGPYPVTEMQWSMLSAVIADLCETYNIPITPKTVLSHAEVQENLGIKQRGKWDIAILPFDLSFNTAAKCGDRMRAETYAKLSGVAPAFSAPITHVVKSGETLSALARKYGVTVQKIVDENEGIEMDLIYPKQLIVIPGTLQR